MIVIGIDPGLKGGIVAIESPRKVILSHAMPLIGGKELDLVELKTLFVHIKKLATERQCDVTVFLEKVRSRPGQGVVAMFTFGRGLGMLEGLLTALEIPMQQVVPQAWVHEMHAGMDRKLTPKARSMLAIRRLYPDINLMATAKSTKMHDGLIDAALIATYGMRKLKGGTDGSKYFKER